MSGRERAVRELEEPDEDREPELDDEAEDCRPPEPLRGEVARGALEGLAGAWAEPLGRPWGAEAAGAWGRTEGLAAGA